MRLSSLGVRARVAVLALPLALLLSLTSVTSGPASTADRAADSQRSAAQKHAGPRFGGTVYERPGESYRDAYRRVRRAYGGSLGAVRMFFPGLPASWSKITSDVDDAPLVVSFRADPGAVLSGRYDRRLARWFATAPTSRRTYWTYWHEPEDDQVGPQTYRRAWRHINRLATRAHNRKLRSTLILMCWTLAPNSGRNWRAYYAGARAIDVLAFDCYNTGRKNGVYRDPAGLLRPVVALARRLDKPWGIAEFGSTVIDSDGGVAGRAAWLRKFAHVVRRNDGEFATYFDSYVGFDYRLRDSTSRQAWREIVRAR